MDTTDATTTQETSHTAATHSNEPALSRDAEPVATQQSQANDVGSNGAAAPAATSEQS